MRALPLSEAKNADEAIVILGSRTDIRLVFTEIDMPGTMNGAKMAPLFGIDGRLCTLSSPVAKVALRYCLQEPYSYRSPTSAAM